MGVVRVDFANFVTIGLIAFIMVYLVNKGLGMAGLSQYQA